MRALGILMLFGVTAGCAATPAPAAKSPTTAAPAAADAAKPLGLDAAEQALGRSDYAGAERGFRAALDGPDAARAAAGLGQVLLLTGRYEEAAELAEARRGADPLAFDLIRARAERARGAPERAATLLEPYRTDAQAPAARLLLGELLLELGKRAEAEPVLMSLIEDYNQNRVGERDGAGLARVGRAAHLLRSPEDANDAFNQAETAGSAAAQTLLWRAELYLDKYDLGHAEEVLGEVLKRAPQHPEAHVLMAEVRLGQALDFDQAEAHARRALRVNPAIGHAYFVLAGIALRDEDLARAEERVQEGLRYNPRDLQLLSLAATVSFVGDQEQEFTARKARVFELNPEYARFYTIVGEFAEWEHRYDELVELMRQAVRLDPEYGKAHGELGLNLIRGGDDAAGVVALRQAFDLDPYNVRVFNTLNLYEKIIPADYVSERVPRFEIRYPKAEHALLRRYVPDLLDRAYATMERRYGFAPQTPVGIELYATREAFSVRTSGLPRTAIQGVCFGKTLASMSLGEERFNLGMTLWHELAHVFHIQLSKSRVPRWFTEGLAEYETEQEQAIWAREHDQELYYALRGGRLPSVGAMTQAFTRAEQITDVATAYYASSQITGLIAQRYGFEPMAQMLRLWASGQRTPEVVQGGLGVSAEALNQQFVTELKQRYRRYDQQFVPLDRVGDLEALEARLAKVPKDLDALVRLALAALDARDPKRATALSKQALQHHPDHPEALYLAARLAALEEKPKPVLELTARLVKAGGDGYQTRMLAAHAELALKNLAAAKQALAAASKFDPSQSEPLMLSLRIARHEQDAARELELLERLARLEQHQGVFHRELLERLLELKQYDRVVKLGPEALWTDLADFGIHRAYAEALWQTGDRKTAIFEWESALLCEARPNDQRAVHLRLSEAYRAAGNAKLAKEHREQAEAVVKPNDSSGPAPGP